MDWNISDDTVGLMLLGLTLVALIVGGVLSFRGLDSVDKAAKEAADAAERAKRAAENVQTHVATTFAAPNAALRELARVERAATSVDTAVGEVKGALAELKGALAPARVYLALALLFFLAALVAFDVVSFDVSTNPGADTTTTTETTP